eukprot:NODE_4423_length_1170_cov_69.376313_g2935_i1.p1 GENE.NODE_4423_length_1170_cov_69.376313_g2935_i1~~NODE_4423_length_1170_cov_69.376313_g2935_i1.p1  ORF type:complete len:303 (+),score=48.99 NODE_4423_length_1170_cov_69.376313_g2935_i1:71-979(+)
MAPIYVINGFYMSMREKYTKPGASIHYFLVEWDSDKLSWGDFRSRVLGATDPPTAEAKSLRREIFDRYQELGLKSQPNVGDNGVHASASPFEALAERINWVGVDLADDAFGKQLLSLGIPKETILAWTKDPQVDYDGKKASLFDSLEDTDADECIKRALKIAGIDKVALPYKTNSAFVFVKPHAVNQTIVSLVEQKLIESGIAIKGHGSIDHAIIESKQLIDNHYYAIANKASLTKPKDFIVDKSRLPVNHLQKAVENLSWTPQFHPIHLTLFLAKSLSRLQLLVLLALSFRRLLRRTKHKN